MEKSRYEVDAQRVFVELINLLLTPFQIGLFNLKNRLPYTYTAKQGFYSSLIYFRHLVSPLLKASVIVKLI